MARKSFKTVPQANQPTPEQVEAFTKSGAGTDKKLDEPTKRVSIDVPESLHTRFKVACTKSHAKMGAKIVAFIERRTRELEESTT